MRPEVVSVSSPLVVIHGTCQVGWVTNECVPPADAVLAALLPAPPITSDSVVPGTLAGRSTENEKASRREPGAPDAAPAATERKFAVTETRSPEANWRLGENAVPRPSGCALKVPAWTPLRDPTTFTETSWLGETAGKSTLVPGDASGVPGNGNTSSPCKYEAGREGLFGECSPACLVFAAAPDPLAIPRATAAPIAAPAPTARTAGRGKAFPDIPNNMLGQCTKNRRRNAPVARVDPRGSSSGPLCILIRAIGRAHWAQLWRGAAAVQEKKMRVHTRAGGSQ